MKNSGAATPPSLVFDVFDSLRLTLVLRSLDSCLDRLFWGLFFHRSFTLWQSLRRYLQTAPRTITLDRATRTATVPGPLKSRSLSRRALWILGILRNYARALQMSLETRKSKSRFMVLTFFKGVKGYADNGAISFGINNKTVKLAAASSIFAGFKAIFEEASIINRKMCF